jgi:hypothetical protein
MLESQWLQKRDDEVQQALGELDLYTPEAQRVILAESRRRKFGERDHLEGQEYPGPDLEERVLPGKSEARLKRERQVVFGLLYAAVIGAGIGFLILDAQRGLEKFLGSLLTALGFAAIETIRERRKARKARKASEAKSRAAQSGNNPQC